MVERVDGRTIDQFCREELFEPLGMKDTRFEADIDIQPRLASVRMRGEDHQLLLPQVVNTIAPVDGKTVKVGWEGTSYGFRTDAVYTGNELAQGTECRMVRPAQ